LFRTGFAVVEFLETNEVELVPGSWLKDKKTCLWPSEWKSTKISTAIRQKATPDDSFNAIRVKILYETGKYVLKIYKIVYMIIGFYIFAHFYC